MQTIRVPCPKIYKANDARVRPVSLAVIHWTASPPKAPDAPDEARMRAWLADTGRQSSTHLVILRDGRVLQASGLDERTWHAGGAVWHGPDGEVRGVNMRSIGIDMENVGPVRRAPDGAGFIDAYGGTYRGAPPTRTGNIWHEPYTTEQIASLADVVRWIVREIPALRDPARWVGHADIQVGKTDPGPLMPWAAVRSLAENVGKI